MNQSHGAPNFVGIIFLTLIAIGVSQLLRGKVFSGLFLISLGAAGLFGFARVPMSH